MKNPVHYIMYYYAAWPALVCKVDVDWLNSKKIVNIAGWEFLSRGNMSWQSGCIFSISLCCACSLAQGKNDRKKASEEGEKRSSRSRFHKLS